MGYRLESITEVAPVDTHCITANEEAFAIAERACEQALAQRTQGMLTRQMKIMLRAYSGRYPTLEEIAAMRMVSPRTIIRKLKAEGTTYQALLDDARKGLSIWLLQNTSDTIDLNAVKMGFSNQSNFGRSFKSGLVRETDGESPTSRSG